MNSQNLLKVNKYFSDPDKDVFENLKYLAQVKRFNTQLMFLTQDDKKCRLFFFFILIQK